MKPRMTLLDYVGRINNAIDLLSDSYAAHLWATVDGLSFDAEGDRLPWSWYCDFYGEVMKFLNGFPEPGPLERHIICDFRMYPIRERIERAEAEFRCYSEIMDKAKDWFPTLSGSTPYERHG